MVLITTETNALKPSIKYSVHGFVYTTVRSNVYSGRQNVDSHIQWTIKRTSAAYKCIIYEFLGESIFIQRYSGVTPGGAQGAIWNAGSKPQFSMCKVSTLLAVLFQITPKALKMGLET